MRTSVALTAFAGFTLLFGHTSAAHQSYTQPLIADVISVIAQFTQLHDFWALSQTSLSWRVGLLQSIQDREKEEWNPRLSGLTFLKCKLASDLDRLWVKYQMEHPKWEAFLSDGVRNGRYLNKEASQTIVYKRDHFRSADLGSIMDSESEMGKDGSRDGSIESWIASPNGKFAIQVGPSAKMRLLDLIHRTWVFIPDSEEYYSVEWRDNDEFELLSKRSDNSVRRREWYLRGSGMMIWERVE